MNDKINAEIPQLAQSAIVEFWVLDATEIGGDFFRFYAGTGDNNRPVIWQGNTYSPIPMQANGFEFKASGSPPRPAIIFGNVGGQFSALALAFDDLIGARLTRKRTFRRFLDGEPGADPTQAFPDDVFFIERKVQETKGAIEFEIGTPIDVEDVSLPRRQFLANLCAWGYRSSECGFTSSTAIAAQDDTAPGITLNVRGAWSAGATYEIGDVAYLTTSRGLAFYWVYSVGGGSDISGEGASPTNAAFWKKDECSKRIRGCEMRFGADPNGLPFGGFPAADRQRG